MSAAIILSLMSLTTCLQDQVVAPTPAPIHAPPPSADPIYAPPPATDVAPAQQPATPAQQPATPAQQPLVYGPPPPPDPYAGAPPANIDAPARRSTFVFAAMPALTFNVIEDGLPALSGALFFGSRLRGDRWALGYQVTGAVGPGDDYRLGHLGHRHSLVAMNAFGSRGFASIGGGLAFILVYPVAIEVETRIGVRLGKRKRGLFGGQLRLGHDVMFGNDAFLRPQIGLFFGFSLL